MYELTQHAQERYAERIMGKDNKMDIQTFISQHKDKIQEDINKMIEYGKVIYEGQQIRSKDTRQCMYILNNNWLVVVGKETNKVITLYKIDLGAGDEFNEMYLNHMIKKLNEATQKVSEKTIIHDELKKSYQNAIEENSIMIEDYKNKIKSLESQNDSLKNLLNEEKNNILILEEELRDIVSIMTSGTKF